MPLAPLWVLERAITSWLALAYRLRGGVPYAGDRLARAASTAAQLRRRAAAFAPPEPGAPAEELAHVR